MSNLFIACGFISLISALHVTMLLDYPSSVWATIVSLTIFWLCWTYQFWRARQAVERVFREVPGFDGFLAFWWGYVGLGGGLKPVDTQHDQSSAAALSRAAERLDQAKQTQATHGQDNVSSQKLLLGRVPVSSKGGHARTGSV